MSGVVPFRDKAFGARYQAMGDEAEGRAEQVMDQLGIKWARFGFQRPPFSIQDVVPFVRYTPDYVLRDRFVEVQGFGRDGTFKLKRDKLQVLTEWDHLMPVDLFLWWSSRKSWAMVPLSDVTTAIDDPERCTLGFFDGSKAYFGIAGAQLTDSWSKLQDAA